jgi:hypothetical protein
VTIYSAIEAQIRPYHDKHGFYPDKVFLSLPSYAAVMKEVALSSRYAVYEISRWEFNDDKKLIFSPNIELKIVKVEELGEFVMVGRHEDYSNYVFEKTVLNDKI